MRMAAVLVMTLCGTAAADSDTFGTPALNGEGVVIEGWNAPRIALTGAKVFVSPKNADDALADVSLGGKINTDDVEAMAADKKAYWTAANIVEFEIGCGAAPCPPPPPPPPIEQHATFLWQRGAKDWEIVAWDIAPVVSGKAQAAAIKKGVMPTAIAKRIDPGSEDAVKLFESTIGDPKLLAASVSPRKDVVLYGNEPKERAVGGPKVKAKLESWKLGFKVRDGIQAGVTSSKTVAWVAANVDASSAKKPKDKPVPYRLFVLYEKTGADWKLVHANFAFIASNE